MRVLSLRALLLLGFVVAMPVLALPPVARRVDELLYGPPPTDFGEPVASPLQEPIPPIVAERVAPASFVETGPAAATLAGAAEFDAPIAAAPPPLAPVPDFAPQAPPPRSPAEPEPVIDANTLARLQQIRLRLEELGADYLIVETTDGGGRYRFHCRMLVDARSRFTRPFEAESPDPLAAGEEVLRAVEAWRAKGQRETQY